MSKEKRPEFFKVNFKVITVYKFSVSKMVVFRMVMSLTYVQLLDRWNGGRSQCLHSILVFTSSSNVCKTYCWNCRTVITYLSVLHGDIDIVPCPMHACRMC